MTIRIPQWYNRLVYCTAMFLAMLCLSFNAYSQDPIFSQFQKSKTYLNPAYTGIDGGWTFTVTEREQWGKIQHDAILPGTFSTQFASFEWNIPEFNNSVGLYFMNDGEGEGQIRTVYSGFNYSQLLLFDDRNRSSGLRLGFGVYYARKWINDWEALVFSDQLHPKGPAYFLDQSAHAQFFEDFQNNPPWWTGLNLGVLYTDENLELGVSSTHVVSLFSSAEVESLQNIGTSLSPRFTLHGRVFIPQWQLGNGGNITPFPSVRIDYQGQISAFTIGNDLWINSLGIGAFYQNTLSNTFASSTHALIFTTSFGIAVQNNHLMDVGFSYDFNLGGLAGYTGGVFELTVSYNNRTYQDKVVCPPVTRAHRQRYENIFYKTRK